MEKTLKEIIRILENAGDVKAYGKGDSVQEMKKFWGDKKIEEIHREVLEAKKKGLI